MLQTMAIGLSVGMLVGPCVSWAGGMKAGEKVEEFILTSSDIAPNATIDLKHVYKGFGCQGENHSPALKWSGAPNGTKSFAITVYDPDAPTGSGWWHWVVYNIPADVTAFPAGAGSVESPNLPPGAVQGRTDFGTAGYGGPCPPEGHGPHRYMFTVHALKTDKLELPSDASAAMVGFMLNANSLGHASLTGLYAREESKP
jgi:Raf kinase inhibitor-like YbhB/YbcL family protein